EVTHVGHCAADGVSYALFAALALIPKDLAGVSESGARGARRHDYVAHAAFHGLERGTAGEVRTRKLQRFGASHLRYQLVVFKDALFVGRVLERVACGFGDVATPILGAFPLYVP